MPRCGLMSGMRSPPKMKPGFKLGRAEMIVDLDQPSNMLEGSHSNERIDIRFAH